MESSKKLENRIGRQKGRFTCLGLVGVVVFAVIAGAVLATMAHWVQYYFAPWLLFPLLMGVCGGAALVAVARAAQIGHRGTLLFGAVLIASITAIGLHYCGYLSTYSTANVKTNEQIADEMPELLKKATPDFWTFLQAVAEHGRPIFSGYTAKGWLVWASWFLDLFLTITGAIVVVVPAIHIPYCNQCGTWFKTIRLCKIDGVTAQRIAELLGCPEKNDFRASRCRISACHGGCPPVLCELSWETPDGAVELFQAWLGPHDRQQVDAVLDKLDLDGADSFIADV